MKMDWQKVTGEINGAVNSDPDTDTATEVKRAIKKFGLNEGEVKQLCRAYGLLLEDVGQEKTQREEFGA